MLFHATPFFAIHCHPALISQDFRKSPEINLIMATNFHDEDKITWKIIYQRHIRTGLPRRRGSRKQREIFS